MVKIQKDLGQWFRDSPGSVLNVIRESDTPLTKAQLVEHLGLSRSAVNQRIDLLLAKGLIIPTISEKSTGGRPAERYEINSALGAILVADVGATGMRVALCDMVGAILTEEFHVIQIAAGPEALLVPMLARFEFMLAEYGVAPDKVLGIGITLPGPVDHENGMVINPPIMTGWHEYSVPSYFAQHFTCPVVVEKDTNAMAYGEHRKCHPEKDNMVFLKIGTGIGTGLIINGEIYRGSDGAAGDIGHIPLRDLEDVDAPLCDCGNTGCVEAYAGGWAMVRDLRSMGHDVSSVADLISAVSRREPDAIKLVKRSAKIIGQAISDLVNIINPRGVVLGGQLSVIDDFILNGVREVVYRRSLPLATRKVMIETTTLDNRAGLIGIAGLVIAECYSPERVNQMVTAFD